MHLQQTKRASRASGGPQYYFHDLTDEVKNHLRDKGVVKVALVTPYGATKTDYIAVSKDKKLGSGGATVAGGVGHDRIQQGGAAESIGESIRKWYRLPVGDFERIDVDIEIRDEALYVTPLQCKYANSGKKKKLKIIKRPLSFTADYQSPFWIEQIDALSHKRPGLINWAFREIERVAADHRKATRLAHIQEPDILRASGPLKHLGVSLGGYVGKGYDCKSDFQFLDYPVYTIPMELKRDSHGFKYQQQKYGKNELSRALLLCATHSDKTVPEHIDVIELDALARYQLEANL